VIFLFRPKPVLVDQIQPDIKETLTVYLEGEGVLQPAEEAYVAAIKGGRLETLRAIVGASVNKGDILGALDTNSLSAKLRATLRSYRAANADLGRVDALLRQGISTPQERDDAVTRAALMRSDLEQAKVALEQSILRSPISGVITYAGFAKNDFIPDGSRVFAIQNNLEQQFRFKIPHADAKVLEFRDGVAQGQFVVEIGNRNNGSASNGEGSYQSFTLPIERVVKESDYDGMYEELQLRGPADTFSRISKGERQHVRIPLRTITNVWVVPRDALVTFNGKTEGEPVLAALVYDKNHASVKKVKVKIVNAWTERLAIAPLPRGTIMVAPGFQNQAVVIEKERRVTLRAARESL
jgi:RND family efflux transporter MFP subunit